MTVETRPLFDPGVWRAVRGQAPNGDAPTGAAYTGLGQMQLRVTYTPNGGGAAVTVDCPLLMDGRLRSASNSYATAAAGGAAVDQATTTDDTLWVGSNKAGTSPVYRLHESFVSFSLAPIPAGATVVGAELTALPKRAANIGYLEVLAYDWGSGLTSADWRTPVLGAAASRRVRHRPLPADRRGAVHLRQRESGGPATGGARRADRGRRRRDRWPLAACATPPPTPAASAGVMSACPTDHPARTTPASCAGGSRHHARRADALRGRGGE